MKLKFKVQPYQTNAVNDVVDCFAGEPMTSSLTYRIDPGVIEKDQHIRREADYEGFKNAELSLQVTAN